MRDEHVIIAGTCPAGAPFRHVAPGAPCVMECVGTTIIKVERADNADHASMWAVGMAMSYNADRVVDRFTGTTTTRAQLHRGQ